ncbi:MAG: Gfo/Idh/MocA family oxidoreductase [Anaerolineae bacterium]|nr:Gfo/Idh/MocA family oxidoreductase [Anaerolineae bacterium]
MNALRAVLVGCGGISRAWLEAIPGIPGLEIVGLVDLDRARATQSAAQFALNGAEVGTRLPAMLERVQPDLVFDCTIPEAHVEVAETALNHGCHVLGEKPLADSLANARRIIQTAGRTGKVHAVIQNRRYDANIRRLVRFLRSGVLGRVTTVHSDFFIGAHFGGFRDQMRHVLLLDMAIHTFDAARLITGVNARAVTCHEWNPPGSWYARDASAVAVFEMEEALVYTYRGSWCAEGLNTTWESSWRIIGTQGSLFWDGGAAFQVETVRATGGFISELATVQMVPPDPADRVGGHAGQIADFVACVRSGRAPETHCTDNVHSLEMVFGAIASAESGRTAPLSEL